MQHAFGSWLEIFKKAYARDRTDEPLLANLTIPDRLLDNLTDMKFIIPYDHTRLTMDDIYRYFYRLSNNNICVGMIQDDLMGWTEVRLSCGYCRSEVRRIRRYCGICEKNICESCFNKDNHDDGLSSCLGHHEIALSIQHEIQIQCDECDTMPEYKSSNWQYANERYFCSDCYQNPAEQYETIAYDVQPLPGMLDFGSLLDWIPVVGDAYVGDFCCVNMNQDSPHYGHVALSCIGTHGRRGYFITPYSFTETMSLINIRATQLYHHEENYSVAAITSILSELGHSVCYDTWAE